MLESWDETRDKTPPNRSSGKKNDAAPVAPIHDAPMLIDPRLADLWSAVWALPEDMVPLAQVAALLRVAYVSGYHDALIEPDRGSLFVALGMRVPARAEAMERPSA